MHAISRYVRGAVREVFSTMLSLEVTCLDTLDDVCSNSVKVDGVIGTVSFAGKMSGTLYLNISDNLAKHLAQQIMNDPAAVRDVIGELTNMVTGNLKTKMADEGYNCQLTIPSMMHGEDIALDSVKAPLSLQNRFTNKVCGQDIIVQVFARLEE
jgi:CheY-specific phosphatase CheX